MSGYDRRLGPCAEHCAVVDECEARGDVIKELRAENERLREALEEMREACQANYMLGIERGKEDARQLRAENERTKAYNEQLNAQADDKGWRLMHRS